MSTESKNMKCRWFKFVLSLATLITSLASTFSKVEGTESTFVVIVTAAACCITLFFGSCVVKLDASWKLKFQYDVLCSLMYFISMVISAVMASKFANVPPLSRYHLFISCAVFSTVSLLFYAFDVLEIVHEKYSQQQDNQPLAAGSGQNNPNYSTNTVQQHAPNVRPTNSRNPARQPNIDVTVVQGSITSATCDAIVNSTSQFDMTGYLYRMPSGKKSSGNEQHHTQHHPRQVGKLLVAQGGQSIANDCANNPLYSSTNLRITDAGALPYKFIFHLNVPNDVNRLGTALLELFDQADKRGVRSLAMPPVGTGNIGLQVQDVAGCIRTAIDIFEQTHPRVLRKVAIYVFDSTMMATFQQKISRQSKVSVLPTNWLPMKGQLCKRVVLSPNSPEFQRVLALFNLTLQKNVSKIERIQNPTLYNQFHSQKKKVTDVLAGRRPIITRELFHGTGAQSCDSICDNNFDRGCSGINGTMYGKGVYFATTAQYSDGYASGNPKHMFLAEVVTGEYCQGKPSMKKAPNQPNGLPYDSVVDNMANPSMFVVFKDASVYPSYLVVYN